MNLKLIDHLGQYVTAHKKKFIDNVLESRTRHVTMVLEDIYQSQNASAVFRTAECFGIQDVHMIENQNQYALNKRVLKGADKWLSIIHHNQKETNNTARCFTILRAQGYKIVATSPSAELLIDHLDVSNKVAIVLGNELHGLSDYAKDNADLQVRIPMQGFTESLNLSVSAAICINEVIRKVRVPDVLWKLTEDEKIQLKLFWYRKLVKNSELVEKAFLKSK